MVLPFCDEKYKESFILRGIKLFPFYEKKTKKATSILMQICEFTWYWPIILAFICTAVSALLYYLIQWAVGRCLGNYRMVSTEEEEGGRVEEEDKKLKSLSELLNRARDGEEGEKEKKRQMSR